MNAIAEELRKALEADNSTWVVRVVRDNLQQITRSLEQVDELNSALLKHLFRVAGEKCSDRKGAVNAYSPDAMINRVDLAHDCFNLENPDG